MLDIISIATLMFILIGLPLILIIIGGSKKTPEEQELEDEEQIKYLNEYQEKKINRKKFWRLWWREKYIIGNKLFHTV